MTPIHLDRSSGSAGGVIATHIDDLLGCCEHVVLQRMQKFLAARFAPVKVQKDNFTHIGMDIIQNADGSAEITQKNFTDSLCLIATPPSPWKDRNRPLSPEELLIRQSKLGELFLLATVAAQTSVLLWRASLPISMVSKSLTFTVSMA